jgi:hypothetical protein
MKIKQPFVQAQTAVKKAAKRPHFFHKLEHGFFRFPIVGKTNVDIS